MSCANTLLASGSDFISANSLFKELDEVQNTYNSTSIIVSYDTDVNFGSSAYCTIPQNGDLLKSVTMKMVLGPLYTVPNNSYVYPYNNV
jgi:hypothetical protein